MFYYPMEWSRNVCSSQQQGYLNYLNLNVSIKLTLD